MKKRFPQIAMMIGSLLLLTLFVVPLWRITLLAPQYPHGVHMFIYINEIGGSEPGTLQNINILNHYVGMKEIVPESIPELTYFPYIIIGFVALGIIASLANKRWLYIAWLSLFLIACMLGMYDFYLWEYDYGHDLSSTAPMKFDDQSFQPPLIGSKVLLNFIAKSYPHIGGYMVMLSIIFASLAVYLKSKIKLTT